MSRLARRSSRLERYRVSVVAPGESSRTGPFRGGRGPGAPKEALAEGFTYPSWAFVIKPVGREKVKLIARWRSDFAPTPSGYLRWKYGIEPIHFLMERKMLKGIKKRAESLSARNRLAMASGRLSAL